MEATSCALLFMCNGLLVFATAYAPHEGQCGHATCQKWQHIKSDDGEESALLQLSRDSLERVDAGHVEVVVSDDGRTSFVSGLGSSTSFGQGCAGNECSERLDDANDEDSFLQTQKGLLPQSQTASQVKKKGSTNWSQVKEGMDVWKKSPIAGCNGFACKDSFLQTQKGLLPQSQIASQVKKKGSTNLSQVKESMDVWKKSPIAGCNGFDCIEQYVNLPDKSFQWQDTGFRIKGDGSMYDKGSSVNWTGYVLNLTSQRWPVPVSNPVWWHILVVIVPDNQDIYGRATLELNYGIEPGQGTDLEWRIDNRNIDQGNASTVMGAQSVEVNADNLKQSLPLLKLAVEKAAYLATTTRTIAASLMNPINSHQVFQDDVLGLERTNNVLKAYTYSEFMRDPDHPEVLIEMPLTKAVVRAMDAITDFTASLATPVVSEFMVAGSSNFGAAAFIACAIDARVKACAPMGIPMDQLGGTFGSVGSVKPWKIHLQKALAFSSVPKGGTKDFKYAISNAQTQSPAWEKFHLIVDPVAWASRLSKPMLWAASASDDLLAHEPLFASIDQFHRMPGPSSIYIEPNSYHINLFVQSLPTTSAFLRGFLLNKTTPNISSSVNPFEGTITVRQISHHRPTDVRLWTQHGVTFRDTIVNETSPLSGNWTAQARHASFMSVMYQWPEPGFAFTISTGVTAFPTAHAMPLR